MGVLLLIAVLAALVAGLMSGGSLRGWREAKLKGEWLLAVVVVAQVAGPILESKGLIDSTGSYLIWLLGFVLLGCVAALNVKTPGLLVILTGVALNLLAILLNKGMPVAIEALGHSGLSATSSLSLDVRHWAAAANSSAASVISDVMPATGLHVLKALLSVGDFMLAIGLATYVLFVTTERSAVGTVSLDAGVSRHKAK